MVQLYMCIFNLLKQLFEQNILGVDAELNVHVCG